MQTSRTRMHTLTLGHNHVASPIPKAVRELIPHTQHATRARAECVNWFVYVWWGEWGFGGMATWVSRVVLVAGLQSAAQTHVEQYEKQVCLLFPASPLHGSHFRLLPLPPPPLSPTHAAASLLYGSPFSLSLSPPLPLPCTCTHTHSQPTCTHLLKIHDVMCRLVLRQTPRKTQVK